MALTSEAENIQNTAQHILNAFKEMNIQSGDVLQYQELYPYLQDHYPKYKDVQKEAEHHLTKEAFVTPAPDGLMLTQVGHKLLYGESAAE
ncbi:hypothetical protein [Pontibacter sp. SGAir0037]|uniref:hypothetical protein n=1 Tax=Pontibacter sp. SGAir0037 TaxID=2571030 RepID=UPI0010CD5D29|nr:hypothetical protein [Pontibacter sp. SGAir0037]QCR23289.1 hypothetical protein C1N53_13710 [Pontibacter sp. SGAir0037]